MGWLYIFYYCIVLEEKKKIIVFGFIVEGSGWLFFVMLKVVCWICNFYFMLNFLILKKCIE